MNHNNFGEAIYKSFTDCRICPRECGVNRTAGESGYCKLDDQLAISSISLHTGEEPVLGGSKGVCNVFFAHCNLQCSFCQNHQISDNKTAAPIMDFETAISNITAILAEGVTALGFVTRSHQIPHMKALIQAVFDKGFRPVIIYNSSAYDKVETLQDIDELIDVYLPDFKYSNPALAKTYSDAEDYPKAALKALREMYRQKGSLLDVNEYGQIKSGLLIRHLVLPGHLANSRDCLQLISEDLSTSVFISLMSQFHPTTSPPPLDRPLTKGEFEEIKDIFFSLGFHNGWIQELSSHSEYLPDFEKAVPFAKGGK